MNPLGDALEDLMTTYFDSYMPPMPDFEYTDYEEDEDEPDFLGDYEEDDEETES